MNGTVRRFAIPGLLAAAVLLSGCNLLNLAIPLASTKLKFGCIPEGTPVDTPAGPRPIETLRAGDLVTGFSGEPVRDGDMFFGRHDMLQRIVSTLHHNSIMIHGERRIVWVEGLFDLLQILTHLRGADKER